MIFLPIWSLNFEIKSQISTFFSKFKLIVSHMKFSKQTVFHFYFLTGDNGARQLRVLYLFYLNNTKLDLSLRTYVVRARCQNRACA